MVNPSTNNTEFVYEEDAGLSAALVDTAKSAVILLFILLGIILNLLLVVAVCKERKFHRPSFFFLLNLSSAELVRSVLCLPFYFIALVDTDSFTEDNEFCKSASFFYTLLAYETMFTLMSLAMARYSIIAHQNFHKKKLTSEYHFESYIKLSCTSSMNLLSSKRFSKVSLMFLVHDSK